MEWIKEIDDYNLLGVLDIMLDLQKEMEKGGSRIILPLFPGELRFPQLCSDSGEDAVTEYCETRYNAVEFLKQEGIVDNYRYTDSEDVNKARFEIMVNRDKFIRVLTSMTEEFQKRTQTAEMVSTGTLWDLIHPAINRTSKALFDEGRYSDAVREAFDLVNNTVKDLVKAQTGRESNGVALMNRAFSLSQPVIQLGDLSTIEGSNIHAGYSKIFAGVMISLGNPKVNRMMQLDDKKTIHMIFLASMMLYKIDERL